MGFHVNVGEGMLQSYHHQFFPLAWKWRGAPFKTTVPYRGPYMGFHVNVGEGMLQSYHHQFFLLTWKWRGAPFETTVLHTMPYMGFHVNLQEGMLQSYDHQFFVPASSTPPAPQITSMTPIYRLSHLSDTGYLILGVRGCLLLGEGITIPHRIRIHTLY